MGDENTTIDVVVADKSPLIIAGLSDLFNADERFNLLTTATHGERFLEAVDRLSFDVGVIGWDMPVVHGRNVLQALRERAQAPRIVVYTGNYAPEVPRQVMQLGGAGFCAKSDTTKQLVETVLAVSGDLMVFPFMDMSNPEDDPFASLTPREKELLVALAKGYANAQIAGDLNISLNTVKFHLKNLYGKLDVRNRAQAVARYLTASDA